MMSGAAPLRECPSYPEAVNQTLRLAKEGWLDTPLLQALLAEGGRSLPVSRSAPVDPAGTKASPLGRGLGSVCMRAALRRPAASLHGLCRLDKASLPPGASPARSSAVDPTV